MDPTTQALLNTLDGERAHVTGILEGLDPEALRQPVLPSGWHCLGLVRHLALDVERFWFRAVVAAELEIPGPDETPGSAWWVEPDTAPAAVFGLYQQEIEHANRIIAATPLDRAPLGWPDELFGEFRLADLRAVLLHAITETSCHAGHLDAARELLDGRRWAVLE
jgi:hypothetical protein